MDSTKQAIRWGIPGWLFIITFFIFNFLFHYFENIFLNPKFNVSILQTIELNFGIDTGLAVLVGFLGIPLGYVIYQVYFAYIKNIVRETQFDYMDKLLKFDNLKSKELKEFQQKWLSQSNNYEDISIKDNLFLKILKKGGKINNSIFSKISLIFLRLKRKKGTSIKNINDYYIDKINEEIKWSFIGINLLNNDTKVSESLLLREQYLSDLYHSLGATRMSIILAFSLHCIIILKSIFFYIINKTISWEYWIIGIISFVVPLLIIMISTFICKSNRSNILVEKFVIISFILDKKNNINTELQ